MASGQLGTIVRHLHKFAGDAPTTDPNDADLLQRFATQRDEGAFTTLVRRHGPMVLAVCRRVLGNHADAEDAFQATFLVLVRKAGSIRHRGAVAGWLHEVALRIALRARAQAHNRRLHEQRVPDMPQKEFLATVVWRDLQPVLDEEVQGLPETCRAAFILCYLEGKTYEEAGRQLSCKPGTISRRLARARELLRLRLTRRGLVLPAGMLAAALSQKIAPAAVPVALITSTVKAALHSAAGTAAAGAISARVAALAEGGLQAMKASKTKMVLALLLTAGLVCAGAAALACANPAATAAPEPHTQDTAAGQQASPKAARPRPDLKGNQPADDPARAKLIVSGQVVSADGQPVAGAAVALVGRVKPAARTDSHTRPVNKTLAEGQTDREGKYRLAAASFSPDVYGQLLVVARASGHGINQMRLPIRTGDVTAKLELPGERGLRGRLVDLQGQPAAGVTVRLEEASGKLPAGKYLGLYRQHAPAGGGYWPRPVVSDAAGRFHLEGLPVGCDLTLDVQGAGAAFARQSLEVRSAEAPPNKEITLSLAPGRVVEGTVTYGDTGKPVVEARLRVVTMRQPYTGRQWELEARADAKGRFRLVPHDGSFFIVEAYPPAGEPYLGNVKEVRWPRGVVLKQEVNLSLRRGIRVRGLVKEAASGKPVAGASVWLEQRYTNNPFYRNGDRVQGVDRIGADGAFTIIVPPGPSHLFVNAPTPDYLHASALTREINGPDVQPNRRYYPDGLAALDLKPGTEAHRVEITLRRGVPLKGRVVGPDGKAVASGFLVCRCYVPMGYALYSIGGLPVKDGRFELPGWDPANPAPLYFLSPERGLGGVLNPRPEVGTGEVTVRLQKVGGAKVRIVDQRGKPLAGTRVTILLPISPGVSFFDPNGFGGPDPTADEAFMGTFDSKNFRNLRTDADGRVELRGLIPGARHWIIVDRPARGMVRLPVDVDAVSGKTLDLKEVTVN